MAEQGINNIAELQAEAEKHEKIVEKITGVTASGFAYEFTEDALDDYDFLEALDRLKGEDDMSAVASMINILLGKEQAKKLKEHVKKTTGKARVSSYAMSRELGDILKNCKAVKN